MSQGIEVVAQDGRAQRILFDAPDAALPLLLKNGQISWVRWGVRSDDELQFPLALPHSGWIRHSFILAGKLKRWQPRPVVIRASAFLVTDDHGQSEWIPLASGIGIHGALIQSDKEDARRAYVVTEPPPALFAGIPRHWPRLVPLPITG